MEIAQMLEELKQKAQKDAALRQELLDTRQEKNPLSAFCAKCRECGSARHPSRYLFMLT